MVTHNLAIGVGIGLLLSGIFFTSKVAQLFRVTSVLADDEMFRTYRIEGQVFVASAADFAAAFDFKRRGTRSRSVRTLRISWL